MFDVELKLLLILIPALPLAAAILIAALGKRVLRGQSHLPLVVALCLSFLLSLLLLAQVRQEALQAQTAEGAASSVGYETKIVTLWNWTLIDHAYSHRAAGEVAPQSAAPGGHDLCIDVTLRADPLTAVMFVTVTLISLLVAIYSAGYMRGDPGYWRFFAYVGLFVFSMTMLVSVSNFVLLYVFWEAVGLCSYLLIGFWFEKPEAAAAGKKAFLVNRVGDVGFALAIFFLWTTYGTLDFHDTSHGDVVQCMGVLGQTRLKMAGGFATGGVGTAICLLLMLGACGKSAQFPLHVWLPDAMEGPSPVSALIHAATMVTAGVYLVARCMPLFVASGVGPPMVAVLGGLTALLAAVIAITQTDLKRILAYSTISQLGYMFLGLGAGTLLGATAGMFHLVTHAFFKALLFLAAGSVMHAMGGVVDLRRLGGLRHRLPTTHWTFLFGCLALAGVFPFAGFWSKDMILEALGETGVTGPAAALYGFLYLAALATAFLTALYTFRAYFLTFFGAERIPEEAHGHAHESPPVMAWPLVVLAVGSLGIGAYFHVTHGLADFLARTPSLAFLTLRSQEAAASSDGRPMLMITSSLVAVAGIGLAAALYLGRRGAVVRLTQAMDLVGLYRLSYGKFFIDQIYGLLVVQPLERIARLAAWIDRRVIDGLVNFCGQVPSSLGTFLRPLQGGVLPFYALAMLLGLLVLLGAMLM